MDVNIEINDVLNEYATQMEKLYRENAFVKSENLALRRLLEEKEKEVSEEN